MTQPDNSQRGSGRTSQQMLQAPVGAVYIWCNSHLSYPKALAQKMHREDLKIVSPSWLEDERWRGLELSGIVVDHAIRLTDNQSYCLEGAMTRVRKSAHT